MKATVGELLDKVNSIDTIIDILSGGDIHDLYDTEIVSILEEYRGVILNTSVEV